MDESKLSLSNTFWLWTGLLALAYVLVPAIASGTPTTHPVPLTKDTKPSTCLECHTDINQGKYVHTAMQMGCTTCHAIDNGANGTTVTLVSPPDQLCFTCHQKSSDPVLHRPYAEGACTVCHSPHASNFPAHTWVGRQELCMGCHVEGLPKVNYATKTVTVPWGRTLTFKEMKGWLYLRLNAAHSKNHPIEGHPVTGPNTALGKGAPDITCLSCHEPHASTLAHLIPPRDSATDSLCLSCHKSM